MATTYHCRLKTHSQTKDGIKIDTKLHYDYIAREGKYANIKNHGEDLRYKKQGNLPSWTNNKAQNFWEAAEQYRRKDGRAFREFELGLQMDLSLDDNIACIDKFLNKTGIATNHTYSYAIHERPARNDKDLLNIHVHIMFNERKIEQDRPLSSAEDFFKRYSRNKDGKPVGGYKVDERFEKKIFLLEARKLWADIVNEKLAERGLDERVSSETLEKQKKELRAKGEHELAKTMNREPAPKMENFFRNPASQERIKQKIQDYENGVPDEKPLEEMTYYERCIALYAKDYVIRKAARKIQQKRMKQQKDFTAQLENDAADELRKAPVVITVGDIIEYFQEQKIRIENEGRKLKQTYQDTRKQIIDEKYISAMALKTMTNNKYQQLYKAYLEASKKYKAETAKEKEILANHMLPNFGEQYNNYLSTVRRLKAEVIKTQEEFNALRNNCLTERKAEYEETVKKLIEENKQKTKSIKAMYGKLKTMEKERDKYNLILTDFTKINPDTILFSDPLPRQLSRNNRIDGITPIKKLEVCAYKGGIYFIFDGDAEHVSAVKLNDDVIKGQVPVYDIERFHDGEKFKIKSVTVTDKKVKLYKEKKPKQFTKREQHANEKKSPTIEKALQDQDQRVNNSLQNAANKLLNERTPNIRLRWHEKENHELSEMERIEKQMYENWHPAYPPRTK